MCWIALTRYHGRGHGSEFLATVPSGTYHERKEPQAGVLGIDALIQVEATVVPPLAAAFFSA